MNRWFELLLDMIGAASLFVILWVAMVAIHALG